MVQLCVLPQPLSEGHMVQIKKKKRNKNGHTKYSGKKAYLKVGLSSFIGLAVFTGSFKRKLFSQILPLKILAYLEDLREHLL